MVIHYRLIINLILNQPDVFILWECCTGIPQGPGSEQINDKIWKIQKIMNEFLGSGVCGLQQASDISTLSEGGASWFIQLHAPGHHHYHWHPESCWSSWSCSWSSWASRPCCSGVLELGLPAGGAQLPDPRPAHAAQPGAKTTTLVINLLLMLVSRANLNTTVVADTCSSQSSCAGVTCWSSLCRLNTRACVIRLNVRGSPQFFFFGEAPSKPQANGRFVGTIFVTS